MVLQDRSDPLYIAIMREVIDYGGSCTRFNIDESKDSYLQLRYIKPHRPLNRKQPTESGYVRFTMHIGQGYTDLEWSEARPYLIVRRLEYLIHPDEHVRELGKILTTHMKENT